MMRHFWKFLIVAGILYEFPLIAQGKIRQLDFDKIDHAQISVEREIYGVYRDGNRIWLLPKFGGFLIESHYNPSGIDSEEAFYMKGRDTAKSERHHLPDNISDSFWRGIFRIDDKLVILDSFRQRFISFSPENKTWGPVRDLVLDLLKPAADSRGQAPLRETQEYQARFRKTYSKIKGQAEVFTDTAIIPEGWRSSFAGSQVLLVSRLPGFSLIGLKCDLSGMGYCQFQRGCFIETSSSIDPESLSGIAISKKRRQILIGDYRKQQIYLFRYDSCFHIEHVGALKLPPQLNALTAIDIDADDNLWISTEEPDPYLNASIYRWKPDAW